MTPEAWITIAVLALAVLLFLTERLPMDVVGVGVLSVLLLAGVVTPSSRAAALRLPALASTEKKPRSAA